MDAFIKLIHSEKFGDLENQNKILKLQNTIKCNGYIYKIKIHSKKSLRLRNTIRCSGNTFNQMNTSKEIGLGCDLQFRI